MSLIKILIPTMIQANDNKNVHEIKNYLNVFNTQKMTQQSRKSLIILPSMKNTHIVFFTHDHGYSQELVHFDTSGKRLGKQSFEYSKTSICMLSDEEVVMYRQVLRFNGDYMDFIYIWNLNNYQFSECRYFGGDSEDYQINVELIVFNEIKIICLCQTRLTEPNSCRLSFYEPQQIYNSKISSDKKKPIHSYFFYAKPTTSTNGFKVKKLNERGMLAIYAQHIPDHLFQFQVYFYKTESKSGQIYKYSFDCFQQDIINGFKKIDQIWQMQTDKMYIKLTNQQINENKQKDYILDIKMCKYQRIETENKGPFNIQFINNFRSIKDINSQIISTKPVQLLHLISGTYFLDHSIPCQQVNGTSSKFIFQNNMIYEYKINNLQLFIEETLIKPMPFTLQELFVFLMQSIILCPCQGLVQAVVSLIRSS